MGKSTDKCRWTSWNESQGGRPCITITGGNKSWGNSYPTEGGGNDHGSMSYGKDKWGCAIGNLGDGEIGSLMQQLQWEGLDLNIFDVSYNKLEFGAVENMFLL